MVSHHCVQVFRSQFFLIFVKDGHTGINTRADSVSYLGIAIDKT